MRPCPFGSHVIVSDSRQRTLEYSPCLFLKMNRVLLNGCHWIPAENIKLKFNPSTPDTWTRGPSLWETFTSIERGTNVIAHHIKHQSFTTVCLWLQQNLIRLIMKIDLIAQVINFTVTAIANHMGSFAMGTVTIAQCLE